jgi:hypothetical protein
MRFSIGYWPAVPNKPAVCDVVQEFSDAVAEVFFPWVDAPSGRAPLPAGYRDQLLADLLRLRLMGKRLNLVLNASCYGGKAFTRELADRVAGIVGPLADENLVDSITTMSPLIASSIKQRFSHLKTRASVNMRLGTLQSLQYVAGIFDGYYLQREQQHDLSRLAELKAWCDAEGKTLHLLANSGCLPWCAVQTFHDNLVAHEAEIDHAACVQGHIPGGCWDYFRARRHWPRLLAGTWIRPEDVHYYEPFVSEMKLATRMHPRPRAVIKAYAAGRFRGNLLDLLEPSHSGLLRPLVIDNTQFPADWFDRTSASASVAATDSYCQTVLERVLVDTTMPLESPV